MPFEIQDMNLTENGFRLSFTKPVDKAIAEKAETWPFNRYYYQYHVKYGSRPYENGGVPVSSVEVSDDGLEVTINRLLKNTPPEPLQTGNK